MISCSDGSVVSPETAAAVQALLQCHDSPVGTDHARRHSEAVAKLEPYVDRMAKQYNESSKVHWFEAGQHAGLQIPNERRWTPDLESARSSVNSALMVTKNAVSMVWCKGSSVLTS